ncbi:hypothetical protein ABIE26_003565 [Pedobacter africanus]|uniref:Uncharacterized protein n=1 Tax=Pedobacter africanus TaxID=151894 RepID=A0ACC6L0M9_9SPHI|nr:hypothetical protein [Pedobacter africanus]MDR6784919.1 hypothetical protein [Pedobacter africanus]
MDDGKYLMNTKGLLENYGKDEMKALLWEMYKGWFLHNATEVDSDRMIDMLLFYDELKDLLGMVNCQADETISPSEVKQVSIPVSKNTPSLD